MCENLLVCIIMFSLPITHVILSFQIRNKTGITQNNSEEKERERERERERENWKGGNNKHRKITKKIIPRLSLVLCCINIFQYFNIVLIEKKN